MLGSNQKIIYICKIKSGKYMGNIKGLVTMAILCLAIYSCDKNRNSPHSILRETSILKEGDIVMRRGTGITSRVVTTADRGSDFSHCGIVVFHNGRTMIVHAVPDEPDFEGDVDRVKMESARNFFSSINASKGCVLRCNNSKAAQTSANVAKRMLNRKILFDHDYNDMDTTKMYCSELVVYAYKKAGIMIIGKERHNINMPGLHFSHVIFPSDILKSKDFKRIADFP